MPEHDYAFRINYASTNRSSCKKCKSKIDKGSLRIAKLQTNPFSDNGESMCLWHHPKCLFDSFLRARATTKKVESLDDLEHIENISDDDKKVIKTLIKEFYEAKGLKPPVKTPKVAKVPIATSSTSSDTNQGAETAFSDLVKLCQKLGNEPKYNTKSELVRDYINQSNLDTGALVTFLKLLIPSIDKRVYNVKDKQLIKIFSVVLKVSLDDMAEDLEQGNVGETVKKFFKKSDLCKQAASSLTVEKVDAFLEQLTKKTKEDEQVYHFKSIVKECTPDDLKYILYLVKKDLRINAREKHILEGLHSSAYSAFQMSHNLHDVVHRFYKKDGGKSDAKVDVGLQLMTPVRPMLAEACKSVAQALAKCPKGMYSEIKYDGERVQLHKKGKEFQFYSRSLKPVLPHKVENVKDFVPQAFPEGNSIILDCEVLLVDTKTGKPLPFGTLGIHKKSEFKAASVCLFVFDMLLYNDRSLVKEPISKRRQLLSEVMTEIPNRIVLSEMKFVKTASQLASMISHVLREGLEGLVLKGINTVYEPGKRHWLKVKKDYLQGGAMADTADLVVLGGYLGTGNKGGMCSVFLMGVYDPAAKIWKTVCKVGNGHDDETLTIISNKMLKTGIKIKGNYGAKPSWLSINKGIMPDYIVPDPKSADVWEITGAEFSESTVHTAGGISIRFPRVTRIRDDKDWKTATDLPRLIKLARTSQEKADEAIQKLMLKEGGGKTEDMDYTPDKRTGKRKAGNSDNIDSSLATSVAKRVKSDNNNNNLPENLADVFTDMTVYVSKKISDKDVLCRYVVAYGGVIAQDKNSADIVVVSSPTNKLKDGKKRSKQWLLQCVRTKRLVE